MSTALHAVPLETRLLSSSQATEWDALLERFPDADFYHLSAYHRLHEANGEGQAFAFTAWVGEQLFFHPFLKRPVLKIGRETAPAGWYDLESVYGYSGPLATTTDPGFLAAAWRAFRHWSEQEHVLCEFVRFNPLSGNWRYQGNGMQVTQNRDTVVLPLPPTPEALWAGYPSVQRNMVRKGEAQGLRLAELPAATGMTLFRQLYAEHMTRLQATAYYFFSDPYFAALATWPETRLRLFTVQAGEQTVAAALFFRFRDRLHYHLSAADPGWRHAAPANLLLHGAALWGISQGLNCLHLGGGRTAQPDDALLRFKASLSRDRRPFMTGTHVLAAAAYDDFRARWQQLAGRPPPPDYLQFYRLE